MNTEESSGYEYQTLIELLGAMVKNYLATNQKQNGKSMKGVEGDAESSHEPF